MSSANTHSLQYSFTSHILYDVTTLVICRASDVQTRSLSHLVTSSGCARVAIQLGGGSIGDKWHEFGLGFMDKESSFKLLDAYFDLGVRYTCVAG